LSIIIISPLLRVFYSIFSSFYFGKILHFIESDPMRQNVENLQILISSFSL